MFKPAQIKHQMWRNIEAIHNFNRISNSIYYAKGFYLYLLHLVIHTVNVSRSLIYTHGHTTVIDLFDSILVPS